jgi:hypothetical protein
VHYISIVTKIIIIMGATFESNKMNSKIKNVKEESTKSKINVLEMGRPTVMNKNDINKYRINSYKFVM